MAKSDRRVRYTKKALHEAVLELLKTKSIDDLTVKEICEHADVNRGTFYLHYTQPSDVLKEVENEFVAENMAFFDAYWENGRDTGIMAEIFRCVMENKEICRILMGRNGDPQFLDSLENLCRNEVVQEWKKEFPAYDEDKLHFLTEYVFRGSMSLILKWIDDDQGLSVEQFAQRMERLGHYSLIAVGEFS